MRKITIIGGGAGGTLLAVNLMRFADAPLEINLIEKAERLNRGLAYSTAEDVHLLNVPAGKMGAFPDRIEHFYDWLTAKNYDYAPTDFVPRKIYGAYLSEVFNDAVSAENPHVKFNSIEGEAVNVIAENGVSVVVTDKNETIPSDKIVIAFGNFLPANLPTVNREYINSPNYFRNAYDTKIVEKIASDADILLIGTGLTAVDNILSLNLRNHQGKIVMLSTHGWLPTVHAPAETYPTFAGEIKDETNLLNVFKIVRRHCESSGNWRGVIDSLRPITPRLWFGLPHTEKRRFMRHLRRLWDISRHRIPPECGKICDALTAVGKLEIVSGKITDIVTDGDEFSVFYKHRGAERSLKTAVIINCTGSESNFARLESALVKNLLANGEIQPDALKMGLLAAPDGEIINRNSEHSETFLTFGTALKGILYESTAMPEIRAQAHDLALKLLADEKIAAA